MARVRGDRRRPRAVRHVRHRQRRSGVSARHRHARKSAGSPATRAQELLRAPCRPSSRRLRRRRSRARLRRPRPDHVAARGQRDGSSCSASSRSARV
jgi:hypothetical protein